MGSTSTSTSTQNPVARHFRDPVVLIPGLEILKLFHIHAMVLGVKILNKLHAIGSVDRRGYVVVVVHILDTEYLFF